ncbi:MAG: bifunctional adenosylcobinamide kinase/adenosylcobinamide-phosphate guanylyltransferase [Alphaproteobacteria bacterium]
MTDDRSITLVLGGARSGKTRHGLMLAEGHREAGRQTVYIATAEARDDEMRARIDHHKKERDSNWKTVDAPFDLAAAIAGNSAPNTCLLVDCLTLWATNLLLAEKDAESETSTLVDALKSAKGPVILVTNEVGLGIVPENALARRFRDMAGRLNQDIAAIADRVIFIAAGLPLVLKGETD